MTTPTGLDNPQASIDSHSYSDLGTGPNAQHHAIGTGPNDAAAGNHKHKLKDVTDYVAPVTALTTHSGHLTPAYTSSVANANNDVMSTAVLEVGTWLVNFNFTFSNGTNVLQQFQLVAGTATCTFEGQQSNQWSSTAASQNYSGSISCIVTVTVAGTVKLQERHGSNTETIWTTTTNSFPNATGYTAIKVA